MLQIAECELSEWYHSPLSNKLSFRGVHDKDKHFHLIYQITRQNKIEWNGSVFFSFCLFAKLNASIYRNARYDERVSLDECAITIVAPFTSI